jgi:hypothetical protein
MYEDTFRVRQLNELKIQQDHRTMDVLRKCMSESGEQTARMSGLLTNFEHRLTALHDLIMPVYDATSMLQIKHGNLHKTVSQLDNIIEYYNSVKSLSQIVQAGPGDDITNYLSHLNKLRQAVDYFEQNRNQSQKRQNEELWAQGKLNVDREFELLLGKFAEPSLVHFDLDGESWDDSADASGILGSKENDFQQMISIIEWFKKAEPAYLDKLYEKIIKNRSQNIIDAIKK